MSIHKLSGQESDGATDPVTDLDERDVRALTSYMTVLDDTPRVDGADGLYEVVSESGKSYLVDADTGSCECADAEYNAPEGGCKHRRRVEFATARREIPTWVDADAVDPDLGRHVDDVALADGGQVLQADADTDGRPDDCTCHPNFEGLACFGCYRAGFETPNPEAGGE